MRNHTYRSNKNKPKNLKILHQESNSLDDDYLYSMTDQKHNNKVNVTVSKARFRATIDTGATINVIDCDTFNRDMAIICTSTRAFAYDTKSPVQFLGKFEAVIATRKRISMATFYLAQKAKKAEICFHSLQPKTLDLYFSKDCFIPGANCSIYDCGTKQKNAGTSIF